MFQFSNVAARGHSRDAAAPRNPRARARGARLPRASNPPDGGFNTASSSTWLLVWQASASRLREVATAAAVSRTFALQGHRVCSEVAAAAAAAGRTAPAAPRQHTITDRRALAGCFSAAGRTLRGNSGPALFGGGRGGVRPVSRTPSRSAARRTLSRSTCPCCQGCARKTPSRSLASPWTRTLRRSSKRATTCSRCASSALAAQAAAARPHLSRWPPG